jgi:hypothetical protein
MATERKALVLSADALRALLSSAIARNVSAEVAVLHIMGEHDFDLDLLQRILTGALIVSLFLATDRVQVLF